MMKIAINGFFLTTRITGMERFALEILKELDKTNPDKYEIVIPAYTKIVPPTKNIHVIYYGHIHGKLWVQTSFLWYIKKNKRIPLTFDSIAPLLRPGVVCIHDITFKVNKNYFGYSLRSKLSVVWRNLQYLVCIKYSPMIITVSEFSKREILNNYKCDKDKIIVIGNGWDHFASVGMNNEIKTNHPDYFTKPYFFSLSSLGENKNLSWIIETAKKHPQYNFLIGGGAINGYGNRIKKELSSNVYFLGYISDETIKYLMKNCKAFLFPSFYEGFGIPPLEALSIGAQIIISNSSCLPEIYGTSAHYIDPHCPSDNLERVLNEKIDSPESVLEKYRWCNITKILDANLSKEFS